jgi:hypothetical protein
MFFDKQQLQQIPYFLSPAMENDWLRPWFLLETKGKPNNKIGFWQVESIQKTIRVWKHYSLKTCGWVGEDALVRADGRVGEWVGECDSEDERLKLKISLNIYHQSRPSSTKIIMNYTHTSAVGIASTKSSIIRSFSKREIIFLFNIEISNRKKGLNE